MVSADPAKKLQEEENEVLVGGAVSRSVSASHTGKSSFSFV